MEGFNFSTQIAVRFAETDAQGVAHNAAYLVWFEVARIEYLARFREGYKGLQAEGYEALTIESHVRYLKPVFFDDRIRVNACCGDIRGARFRYEYVLDRDGEFETAVRTIHIERRDLHRLSGFVSHLRPDRRIEEDERTD